MIKSKRAFRVSTPVFQFLKFLIYCKKNHLTHFSNLYIILYNFLYKIKLGCGLWEKDYSVGTENMGKVVYTGSR